jgi:hypothetical protein
VKRKINKNTHTIRHVRDGEWVISRSEETSAGGLLNTTETLPRPLGMYVKRLRGKIAKTVEVAPLVFVDYNKKGEVLGVEIL